MGCVVMRVVVRAIDEGEEREAETKTRRNLLLIQRQCLGKTFRQ